MRILPRANLLGLAIVVTAATFVVAELDHKIGPNLASGAIVMISSRDLASPDPAHVIDGDASLFAFHTRAEQNPWVLLDLRREKVVRHIIVYNRLDCCRERAVPLVLKVSHDSQNFTEVARMNEPFGKWDAEVPLQSTRFIRAELQKFGILYLNEIEVR